MNMTTFSFQWLFGIVWVWGESVGMDVYECSHHGIGIGGRGVFETWVSTEHKKDM